MTINSKSVQLATEREAKASGKPGPDDVYYSSTDYHYPIPGNLTKAILCSQSDGTGETYVDDKITIKINGEEIYSYDYSHGNQGRITPLPPTDLLAKFTPYSGITVNSIETKFTDLYKNSNGASNFFLYMEYSD